MTKTRPNKCGSPPRPPSPTAATRTAAGPTTHRVGADEKREEHDERRDCHRHFAAANTGNKREADIEGDLKHRSQPLGQLDA